MLHERSKLIKKHEKEYGKKEIYIPDTKIEKISYDSLSRNNNESKIQHEKMISFNDEEELEENFQIFGNAIDDIEADDNDVEDNELEKKKMRKKISLTMMTT